MFVVIFTSSGIVWHSPSPYRHNKYPFTPIWGYRRAKTRQPYGVVRGLRDLQRSVNKREFCFSASEYTLPGVWLSR